MPRGLKRALRSEQKAATAATQESHPSGVNLDNLGSNAGARASTQSEGLHLGDPVKPTQTTGIREVDTLLQFQATFQLSPGQTERSKRRCVTSTVCKNTEELQGRSRRADVSRRPEAGRLQALANNEGGTRGKSVLTVRGQKQVQQKKLSRRKPGATSIAAKDQATPEEEGSVHVSAGASERVCGDSLLPGSGAAMASQSGTPRQTRAAGTMQKENQSPGSRVGKKADIVTRRGDSNLGKDASRKPDAASPGTPQSSNKAHQEAALEWESQVPPEDRMIAVLRRNRTPRSKNVPTNSKTQSVWTQDTVLKNTTLEKSSGVAGRPIFVFDLEESDDEELTSFKGKRKSAHGGATVVRESAGGAVALEKKSPGIRPQTRHARATPGDSPDSALARNTRRRTGDNESTDQRQGTDRPPTAETTLATVAGVSKGKSRASPLQPASGSNRMSKMRNDAGASKPTKDATKQVSKQGPTSRGLRAPSSRAPNQASAGVAAQAPSQAPNSNEDLVLVPRELYDNYVTTRNKYGALLNKYKELTKEKAQEVQDAFEGQKVLFAEKLEGMKKLVEALQAENVHLKSLDNPRFVTELKRAMRKMQEEHTSLKLDNSLLREHMLAQCLEKNAISPGTGAPPGHGANAIGPEAGTIQAEQDGGSLEEKNLLDLSEASGKTVLRMLATLLGLKIKEHPIDSGIQYICTHKPSGCDFILGELKPGIVEDEEGEDNAAGGVTEEGYYYCMLKPGSVDIESMEPWMLSGLDDEDCVGELDIPTAAKEAIEGGQQPERKQVEGGGSGEGDGAGEEEESQTDMTLLRLLASMTGLDVRKAATGGSGEPLAS